MTAHPTLSRQQEAVLLALHYASSTLPRSNSATTPDRVNARAASSLWRHGLVITNPDNTLTLTDQGRVAAARVAAAREIWP